MIKNMISIPTEVELILVELHASELHRIFTYRLQALIKRFVEFIIIDNMDKQKKICERYEIIQEKALKVPDGYKELADQKQYMEHVEKEDLPELIIQIEESRQNVVQIFSLIEIKPEHIELNNITFTWPNRILPILQEHKEIFNSAKEKAENHLKDRRFKFEMELDELNAQVEELRDVSDLDEMPFYVKKVQALQKQLQTAQDTISSFNKEETLFNWEVTTYPQRKKILNTLEPFQNLYTTAVAFQRSYRRWMDGSILELEAEQVEIELDTLKRDLHKVMGTIHNAPATEKIAAAIREKMDEFVLNIPMMQVLCNPGMRDRHWEKLSEVASLEIKPDSSTSLSKMLKLNLEGFLANFQEISDSASKEYTLEKNLFKMGKEWEPIELILLAYRESGTYVLTGLDDAQQLLDDQIVKTQSMRGSPYIKPFETQIKEWEKKLLISQEIFDEWLKVQATWLYLEPIFSSEDIMNQMPEEGKKFKHVDFKWRQMMEVTHE
jgi:dynein heavy chain, axonemal